MIYFKMMLFNKKINKNKLEHLPLLDALSISFSNKSKDVTFSSYNLATTFCAT